MCNSKGPILPLVLCGGIGRRLAPLSSLEKPKQFHSLTDPYLSLFQQTILRVGNINIFAPPLIFGNFMHVDILIHQMQSIACRPNAMFLEKLMRNTAAPVIISALYAQKAGFKKMLVLPSDHNIQNTEHFISDVISASENYQTITYFGVKPDFAATGYGYIQKTSTGIQFIEKPDRYTAEKLIQENAHWNSGIFLLDIDAFLSQAALIGLDYYRLLSTKGILAYNEIENISFDKFFCERFAHGGLIEASFDWADLGSWKSLLRKREAA